MTRSVSLLPSQSLVGLSHHKNWRKTLRTIHEGLDISVGEYLALVEANRMLPSLSSAPPLQREEGGGSPSPADGVGSSRRLETGFIARVIAKRAVEAASIPGSEQRPWASPQLDSMAPTRGRSVAKKLARSQGISRATGAPSPASIAALADAAASGARLAGIQAAPPRGMPGTSWRGAHSAGATYIRPLFQGRKKRTAAMAFHRTGIPGDVRKRRNVMMTGGMFSSSPSHRQKPRHIAQPSHLAFLPKSPPIQQPTAAEDTSAAALPRFRGVYKTVNINNVWSGKWRVIFSLSNARLTLGCSFNSQAEAAAVYDRAALILKGRFAETNFPASNYLDDQGNLLDDDLTKELQEKLRKFSHKR